MASLSRRRADHSIGLLLPDARVLAAGGDWTESVAAQDCAAASCELCIEPDPPFPTFCVTQDNTAEVYSPPYLYDQNGNWAARPTIDVCPNIIFYGQTFQIQVGGGPLSTIRPDKGICLIRLGSVTHSFDFDARYVPLQYTDAGGGAYNVSAPPAWNIAPRGYYMLFVLKDGHRDDLFVPSQAKIVKLDLPPNEE